MERWTVLQPAVEDGGPLTRAAAHTGVPISTAQRGACPLTELFRSGLFRPSR